MNKSDIALWKAYKLGNLKRNLTSEEEKIVFECDRILDYLLPSKSFKEYYRNLQIDGWNATQVLNILTMTYRVPASFVEVRINDVETNLNIIDESNITNDKDAREVNVKIRGNLSFWKVYKLGKLKRELYPLETERIIECDNAMEMLVSNDIFVPLYEFLNSTEESKMRIVTMLAIRFKVPTDIIEVKIYEYEKQKDIENNGPKLVK